MLKLTAMQLSKSSDTSVDFINNSIKALTDRGPSSVKKICAKSKNKQKQKY